MAADVRALRAASQAIQDAIQGNTLTEEDLFGPPIWSAPTVGPTLATPAPQGGTAAPRRVYTGSENTISSYDLYPGASEPHVHGPNCSHDHDHDHDHHAHESKEASPTASKQQPSESLPKTSGSGAGDEGPDERLPVTILSGTYDNDL